MKISSSVVVASDPDRLFALLNDPPGVVGCIPGAALTGQDGEEWTGGITVRVGPIKAEYAGRARFDRVDPTTRSLSLHGRGADLRGSGDAEADVDVAIAAHPEGAQLNVAADLLIRGKLAQFGKGAIGMVLERILEQFATNLGALERANAGDRTVREGSVTPDPLASVNPVVPRPTRAAPSDAALDGFSLIVKPLLDEHSRCVAIAVGGLALGWVMGRAITIERYYGRRG